jgi:hypothetical protein
MQYQVVGVKHLLYGHTVEMGVSRSVIQLGGWQMPASE